MTATAAPNRSRAAGCAIWGSILVIVIVIGGLIFLANFSVGGEMPELRRPMAVLRGAAELDGTSPKARFEAALRLDDGAVAAMHEGDGLVHLELDLEAEPDVGSLLVGVRWTSRAQVQRPIQELTLDEDVRWTYGCEDTADCARTIGVDIELPAGVEGTRVSWRLVASVRPPREATVPEVAVVELALVEASE
jgi:hypothetical protein